MLSRLRHIEALLEDNLPVLTAPTLQGEVGSTQALAMEATETSSPGSISSAALQETCSSSMGGSLPMTPWHPKLGGNDLPQNVAELPPLTIPIKHRTSSNYLLCLPAMKAFVGEYPTNLFFMLESRNPLAPGLSTAQPPLVVSPADLEEELLDSLVAAFFSQAYQCHPILDCDEFRGIYRRFLARGLDNDIESALCMVVLPWARRHHTLPAPLGSIHRRPAWSTCKARCRPLSLCRPGPSLTASSSHRHWFWRVCILHTS